MGGGDLRPIRQLHLTLGHYESMRSHVEACLPLEGCGLLAGKRRTVVEVMPIANQAGSPVRFRMDPIEQLRALDRIDAQGLKLLAIFHSHPAGPAAPSETDIAEAAYPVAQLIWSHQNAAWILRGFWIDGDRVSDVKLYIADSARVRQNVLRRS